MRLKCPGFNKPHDKMIPRRHRFPQYFDKEYYPITVRERSMLAFMDRVTDKPGWREKVSNTEIAEKWRVEARTQMEHFSDQAFNYCIAELRDKATEFRDTGMVVVYNVDVAVTKSDEIVPDELKMRLQKAVAILEDVPESLKDWHPGSNNLVLDLVHPSLFPLVYGRSRVLPEGSVGVHDCIVRYGEAETIAEIPEDQWADRFSPHYQWLPCDVSVDTDGQVKFLSYVNNLHPHHTELYTIIEELISKAIPLWDQTLSRVDIPALSQIRIKIPEREYDPSFLEGRPPQEDDPSWDGEEMWVLQDEWEKENHLDYLIYPEPDEYTPLRAPRGVKHKLQQRTSMKGRLQVIVKLANIHLTPEKPSYDGGSWHIEGMLNEHICATALYYYDSENITESFLSFRRRIDGLDLHMLPMQQKWLGVETLYDVEQDGPQIQTLGSVLTREGRLLAFPNVVLHKVSPFRLADATKPGHRKIVALFLVDPHIPVISTANVPPQRKDWWAKELRSVNQLRKLPEEMFQKVVNDVEDFPFGLDEAKRFREQLMEERKSDEVGIKGDIETFSFCEH